MKNTDVAKKLVAFQNTGRGFDGLWAEIGGDVREFARSSLRKLGVKAGFGDDEWAVDDVVGQTTHKLLALAAPRAGGRFNPAKATNAGVRGWLCRIVRNEAVNWTRKFRSARGLKISAESSLAWNEPQADDSGASVLKRLEAKVNRADLLPILEECIGLLADSEHRQLVNLKLFEGLSIRDTADKLAMSPATVQRRLKDAFDLLRPLLAARGIDKSWLAA
jgi:RNA polymerase sigma factor (sigma-70 family)